MVLPKPGTYKLAFRTVTNHSAACCRDLPSCQQYWSLHSSSKDAAAASSLEPLASPTLLPLHSSRAWGIFSPVSKGSSFLGCPCSAGMAGISLLEFYFLQHLPKMMALPVAGASAERAGRMQYLVSRPLCVTLAKTGLFLGPTISYRQDSCRGPIKVVASAVCLHSFKGTRGTQTLGMSWRFWEISSVA